MTLTPDLFSRACESARANLKVALDLLAIHGEKAVSGPQHRSSLNPFTALAAAGAWERFLADVVGAAQNTAAKPWPGPGHFELPERKVNGKTLSPKWIPSDLNTYLRGEGVITGIADLTDFWEAWLQDPAVVKPVMDPRDWDYVRYPQTPSRFEQALKNAQYMRNGAAHFALPQNAIKSIPYGYIWEGDAGSDTIQHWAALAVTALFLQLIDCSIAAIAKDHGWTRNTDYRPIPPGWFKATVPASDKRYPGLQFWKGEPLR